MSVAFVCPKVQDTQGFASLRLLLVVNAVTDDDHQNMELAALKSLNEARRALERTSVVFCSKSSSTSLLTLKIILRLWFIYQTCFFHKLSA